MPERTVVCNTSPLLYLFQVGQLGLLQSLYGEVVTPQAVQDELHAGALIGCSIPDLAKLPWVKIHLVSNRALLPAVVDLGLGEACGPRLLEEDAVGHHQLRRESGS